MLETSYNWSKWCSSTKYQKVNSSTEKVQPCCSVTFNIMVIHIFPENIIELTQVVQNIWRFFSSILTIFINFSGILIFPCYKETNDVSIEQIMSVLLYFQLGSLALVLIYIDIRIVRLEIWRGCQSDPARKRFFEKPNLNRVNQGMD